MEGKWTRDGREINGNKTTIKNNRVIRKPLKSAKINRLVFDK
jgi:hypothetical protein